MSSRHDNRRRSSPLPKVNGRRRSRSESDWSDQDGTPPRSKAHPEDGNNPFSRTFSKSSESPSKDKHSKSSYRKYSNVENDEGSEERTLREKAKASMGKARRESKESPNRRKSRDSRSRSPGKRRKYKSRSRSPKKALKSALKKTRTPSPPKMRMDRHPSPPRDSHRQKQRTPPQAGWRGRKVTPPPRKRSRSPRNRGGRSPPRKPNSSSTFGALGAPPGALSALAKDTGFRHRGHRISPPKNMKSTMGRSPKGKGGGRGGFGGGGRGGGRGGSRGGGGKPPPAAMAGGFTGIKTFAELTGGAHSRRSPPRRGSLAQRSPPRRDRKRSASPRRQRSPARKRSVSPRRSRESPKRERHSLDHESSGQRKKKSARFNSEDDDRSAQRKRSKSPASRRSKSPKHRKSKSPRRSRSPRREAQGSKYDDNFKIRVSADGDRSAKRDADQLEERLRRSMSLRDSDRSRSNSRDPKYSRRNGHETSTPAKKETKQDAAGQDDKTHVHADDPNDARSILARRKQRFGAVEANTSKSEGNTKSRDDDYDDPERNRGQGDFLKNHTNQRKIKGRPFPLVHHGRNTESFEPDYTACDMRVNIASHRVETKKYPYAIHENDVMVVPDLYHDFKPNEIYERLLAEIDELSKLPRYQKSQIWTPWHGDNHLIADDKCGWTRDAPFFRSLMDRIREYFDMDIRATRFNWYKDDTDWKPYHFDAAAVKLDKARTQNTTIGVSFGAQRDIAFEHHKTRTRIAFPLPDGSAFGFGRLVNYDFRHSVPAIHPDKQTGRNGRISIIAWGVARQEEPI